jgi:outer membrane protein OmpA-like peptidoglycan-associated protein
MNRGVGVNFPGRAVVQVVEAEEDRMRTAGQLVIFAVLAALALPAAAKGKQLELVIAKEDVNLSARTVGFRLNRPCASAQIQVFGAGDTLMGENVQEYKDSAAGARLSIEWPQVFNDVARIEIKATDVDGYWVSWEIIPFFVEIPHEEVVFETAKSVILPSEAPKLDAALVLLLDAIKKHGRDMQCEVYVAGFTDTVDSVAYNRQLSLERARSIARYFVEHGLKGIPIWVRGFGEEVLAVETADSVAEPRNRRASYIVGVVPPDIKGPGTWQRLQ